MDDEWNSNHAVQDDDVEVQTVDSPNENLPREPIEELQATILQEEHKEKLGNKPVNILFTGLSGASKSTAVNTMLGEVLAKTGSGPDSIETPKSCYKGEFEGVKLHVYDTNGYSKSNHKIPKSTSIDLILICIKITNHLSDMEMQLLHALGKALDKEAWNRTVIVLTFANLLIYDSKIELLRTKEAKCQAINDIKDEYMKSIRKRLKEFMDKETLRNIPFCLAGKSDPFDPTKRSARMLPTTEDWLVDLWEICADRINPEYKPWFDRLIDYIREKLYKMFKRRTEDQQQQSVEEQPNGGQQVEEQQVEDQQDEGQQVEEQEDGGQQDEEQDEWQQDEEQQDEGQQVKEEQDGGQQDEEGRTAS